MKKLKDILSEAYAWERRPGKPLPTLAEVQAEYLRNEAADAVKAKVAKLEKEIADLKHQYYSVSDLSPEREAQLRKQMGEKGRELKRAKREEKTGSAGYNKSSKSGAKPDFLDLDNDGNKEEPMKQAAGQRDDVNEYGDDETHSLNVPKTGVDTYDAAYEDPKDAMNEAFWNRVKGNFHGHEYILREAFRK
jgi:hypothetical protein